MSLPFRIAAGSLAEATHLPGATGIPGTTRRELVLRGALGALAAGGAAAVGPFVRDALAQSGRVDIEVLQFAYLLERLEADYYARALDEVPQLSAAGARIARELARNEAEHVETLGKLLGQLAAPRGDLPRFAFGDAFASEARFLEVAQELEETGVSAYNGAGPLIEQSDILTAAGQIVQVEARHAAWIRFERGEEIAPAAFDRALSRKRVERRVAPYLERR